MRTTVDFDNQHQQKIGKAFSSNLNIIPFLQKDYPVADNCNDEKPEILYDSIRYSRRLQGNMMSRQYLLDKLFPESFLLDIPKHGVSGDFWWIAQVDKKIIIAVGDCTGHGVPGALMSVLGISLLNQIVIEEKKTDPSQILQQLDWGVAMLFKDAVNMNIPCHDGMDISLCAIDYTNNLLEFSGALRPIYLFRERTLSIKKGSRFSIGGLDLKQKNYEKHTLKFSSCDSLYMFSDGYLDQIGGPKNKKLLGKNFRNMLSDICQLTMSDQKKILNGVLEGWKGKSEQTDDIMVIGLKL